MPTTLWRQRKFIWQGALRDIRHRHTGTAMGALWHVILPLVQLLIYAVVFSRLMQARLPSLGGSLHAFTVYLCAGFIPWLGFCETLARCTLSLKANSPYLRKLPIVEQAFVAQDALSSFLSTAIAVGLMVVVITVLGHAPSLDWLHVAPILLLMQMLAFGLGMALGAVNVFFGDVSRVLPVVLTFWMWCTPIVYVADILPDGFRKLLWFNPAFYHVEALHRAVVYRQAVPAGWYLMMAAMGVGACLVGHLVLRALRSDIRDAL